MGDTLAWVAIAVCIGLLSGCVLPLLPFMLTALGSLTVWTVVAFFETATLWSWAKTMFYMAIALQVGYVVTLGLRACISSRRRRDAHKT